MSSSHVNWWAIGVLLNDELEEAQQDLSDALNSLHTIRAVVALDKILQLRGIDSSRSREDRKAYARARNDIREVVDYCFKGED